MCIARAGAIEGNWRRLLFLPGGQLRLNRDNGIRDGGDLTARMMPSCLIPGFDGAPLSGDLRDALWDRFFTAAPQRQRRSVERYSIVKRA